MIVKFQIRIKKNHRKAIGLLLGTLFLFSFSGTARAESVLPEIMTGQVQVTQTSGDQTKTYYGGFTGNEIVLNHDSTVSAGFQYNKTAKLGLANCVGADLTKVSSCFFFDLNPFSNAVKMMRSRTSINGSDVIEMTSLFYGSRLIVGDAYSGTNDLNNFSFWGKSIAQSAGDISNSDAPLKISGYQLNNDSQSSWLDSNGNQTSSIKDFISKAGNLYSNATPLATNALSSLAQNKNNLNLYLQAGSDIFGDIHQTDAVNFPGGKVWSVDGDLNIGANKQVIYHGIGTLLIKGNLIVGNGTNFVPADAKKDHLGIIVIDE